MPDLKKQLLDSCTAFVEERAAKLGNRMKEIEESLLSETKSTAGDKHETGRAMLQIEREKTGKQLAEVRKLQETLLKVDISPDPALIHLGSLVYTSQANYFLAISCGKITVNKEDFFAIAPNTPIGQLLLGKKAGDEVSFNGRPIRIEKVV
ncbi:hypothetical protein GWK08_12480 [Leptobacterium flavescens]|uniref:3-oxoacyl-ACP synthase n=1 Tax=Leptobacterium flavescens TaxID=472055 RepID=A0A6P0ULN9_9FLAO|nr:GreA/GreB family elongation factor [Leptobacterium flavescens]NER14261.1 hypothetical protein [Leptobacterium flavescens]